ncbi:MAG TPA: hypothetical protein VGQ51_01870 [Puia sp.]|nr:hypothetical protein [Puia sp.]
MRGEQTAGSCSGSSPSGPVKRAGWSRQLTAKDAQLYTIENGLGEWGKKDYL